MIFKGEEQGSQFKFIAKLEGLGIYDLLKKWFQSDNDDIQQQVSVFQI